MPRKGYLSGGYRYNYKEHTPQKRSGLEDRIAAQIKRAKINVVYEAYELHYEIPASMHTYTPDFILPNNIVVEAKGIFDVEDRKKHLLIREQFPALDIRFVFSNPNHKLYKGAKTTYADWCDKHHFKYAKALIPSAWFDEAFRPTQGLLPKKQKTTTKKGQ